MRILFTFVAVALLLSCSTIINMPKDLATGSVHDSIKHEMIVMDPGFESWFTANSKPDWYHQLSYYENWNRQYTHAWNAKISNFPNGHLLNTPISYEDSIDYGMEINHKLFYYFQYVERVLRIAILKTGPGYVKGF